MKIFLLLIVIFGAIYFVYQRINLIPAEDRYLKSEDLSNPTIMKNGQTLIIQFAKCNPEKKSYDVAFGKSTIEIIGKDNDKCQMNYSNNIENPKEDTAIITNCNVPLSKGELQFQLTNTGPDFSSISKYCRLQDQ